VLRFFPSLILVVAFFMLLPNYKGESERFFHQLENGCLVYSLHFKMALEANRKLAPHFWTRTLAIQFSNRLGHAVVVFVYMNMTFIYDPAQGSFVAAAYPLYEPKPLAEIAYPNSRVTQAYFLEPTFTLHYP
jgi:hypothetical protein